MKKTMSLLAIVLLIVMSCGKDGKPGSAYLALNWDWYVDSYWDDNPGIPSLIVKNREYNSNPNTYNFQYACSNASGNAWYWSGTYKISINPGGKKRTFKDGENGKNRHYLFMLTGLSKGSLSVTEKNDSSEKPEKSELGNGNLPVEANKRRYIGETISETIDLGEFQVEIEKRMFTVD